MKTINAKYTSCRPFNRLYVGVIYDTPIDGAISSTDHFDNKNNNCWQGAIAGILEYVLINNNINYIDKSGVNIFLHSGTKRTEIEKILKEEIAD